MENDIEVLKRNKVSYVLLKMCGESTCFAVEDRYDKRGNHIYSHLLRTASGSFSTYNDKNQLIKTSWGIWGSPKREIDDVLTYTYESCGNMNMQIFLTENDTTWYQNEYDNDCRLAKVTEVYNNYSRVKEEYHYDKNGWLVESTFFGNKRTFVRDSCGRILTETWYKADTIEHQWRNTYDHLGRLVYQEIEPPSNSFSRLEDATCESALYTYNSKGQIQRHYAYFGDPCVGGFYMDLEYEYYNNGLLKGAYWYGEKGEGMIIEYLYQYHR